MILLAVVFNVNAFDKVVIWGHKKHTHTHYYIHNAFYIAFKSLGYTTYWFDDYDNVENIDFTNSLFLTEGQVDDKIPLRNDAKYILHNCSSKYSVLPKSNFITLQVYTDDLLKNPKNEKIEPFIYYNISERTIYMPWATDLLPHEIDELREKVKSREEQPRVAWIGTIGDGYFGNINQINPFVSAAKERGISFLSLGPGNATISENVNIIMNSYMAPAIVGKWQKEKGYIPCRIFKNISYGALGITNSQRVFELFEGKIVYNPDTYQLFFDAEERVKSYSVQERLEMMEYVKNKHTYISRIERLMDFLNIVENEFREQN